MFVALGSATEASDSEGGVPVISPEFLDERRSLDDDSITFCLNPDSALMEFDRDIAQAIADVLLLDADFYELVSPVAPYRYDYRLPQSEAQLFLNITNNCDAIAGYRLTADSVPQWLTVSRPYLETRVAFVTTDENYRSFADLPAREEIGVRMGATGHRELRAHLRTLPAEQRPIQVPYPTNELLIERLRDGSLSTILVWELAPILASEGDPGGLGIKATFPPPFPIQPLLFGVAIPRQDTFLRGLVDDAIEELVSTGAVEDILSRHVPGGAGEAARPPSP